MQMPVYVAIMPMELIFVEKITKQNVALMMNISTYSSKKKNIPIFESADKDNLYYDN